MVSVLNVVVTCESVVSSNAAALPFTSTTSD